MLLTKFFNQGGAEHCAQWMSWFDKASGKKGATALRTKLKVMQVRRLPARSHSPHPAPARTRLLCLSTTLCFCFGSGIYLTFIAVPHRSSTPIARQRP